MISMRYLFVPARDHGRAILCLLMLSAVAHADLPSPRLDRVFPPGAAAGSTVVVEISGTDLDAVTELRFDHPGIMASHAQESKFHVTVAANVPAGTYDVRAVGRFGVSSPRLFAVSRDVAEVEKKRGNDERANAQPITVNTVVSGITDGNREDFYRFTAKKGQRVVLDCSAQSIDSALDATLTLSDTEGRQVASNGDYNGRDPLIDFVVPKDGDFIVALADLSFRGGQHYRLTITDKPLVESVFPRAVRAGTSTQLTVFGRNLGSQARPSIWADGARPLDEYHEPVTPPDVLRRGTFPFAVHPTTHSVLPTAATCTLTGFQHRGIPLLATDTLVTLEREPNDVPTAVQTLTLPAVVSGRFDRERDADRYEFEVPNDGPYTFDVYCERIAGHADPYLVVSDEKGDRVTEFDDYGSRVNAFDGHLRDPHGTVGLVAKKKYRVLVQDRYRRGGARYQYVLSIHAAIPDFSAAVIHSQNPGPGGVNVRRGGAAYLDVVLHHIGGVTAPVTITAEGLPKGLHVDPTSLHTDTRGTVVLWADADAPAFVGPIRLFAQGGSEKQPVVREVRSYTRVEPTPNQSSSRPTRELVVGLLPEPTPFALAFEKNRVEVESGKKVDVRLRCDRLAPEFQGPVTVIELSRPGPIQHAQATVVEGNQEVTITFSVQPNARPGSYTFSVLGQAQVPWAKEPGKPKTNVLVSLPSRPLTLVVTEPSKSAN